MSGDDEVPGPDREVPGPDRDVREDRVSGEDLTGDRIVHLVDMTAYTDHTSGLSGEQAIPDTDLVASKKSEEDDKNCRMEDDLRVEDDWLGSKEDQEDFMMHVWMFVDNREGWYPDIGDPIPSTTTRVELEENVPDQDIPDHETPPDNPVEECQATSPGGKTTTSCQVKPEPNTADQSNTFDELVPHRGARSKEPPSCSRSVTRPTCHDLVPWSLSGGKQDDIPDAGLTETPVGQSPHYTPGKPFQLQNINCPNIVARAPDWSPAAYGHPDNTTQRLGLQHSTPVSSRGVPLRIEDYLLSSPLMPTRGKGGPGNQAVALREAAKNQQLSPQATTPRTTASHPLSRGGQGRGL